jgi:hypothetical protein
VCDDGEVAKGEIMRFVLRVFALCAVLMGVAAAQTDPLSDKPQFHPDKNHGYGLLQACTESDNLATTPYDTESVTNEAFFCTGYLGGITQALFTEGIINVPADSTDGNVIVMTVVKYMKDHPEMLAKPAYVVVRAALVDAWGHKAGKQ